MTRIASDGVSTTVAEPPSHIPSGTVTPSVGSVLDELTLNVRDTEHPYASSMRTLYVPGPSPARSSVVARFDHE